jgi:hypothetical protein
MDRSRPPGVHFHRRRCDEAVCLREVQGNVRETKCSERTDTKLISFIGVAELAAAIGSFHRDAPKSLTSDEKQVVDTVDTIFTAARADDVSKFDSVAASDSHIFDGGAQFNGDTIIAFSKAQHAAGKRYEWSVTEPDVPHQRQHRWNKDIASMSYGAADSVRKMEEPIPQTSTAMLHSF